VREESKQGWNKQQNNRMEYRQDGREGIERSKGNVEVTRPAGGMSADHAIIQEGNNYLPVLLITI
jgi:hypothetical protein